MRKPHMSQPKRLRLNRVKTIFAVASGKGGVGKSTVAANLAVAWQGLGYQVGVLDADIYGPNQPKLLGAQGQSTAVLPDEQSGRFQPVECQGLYSMSVAYLTAADTPMVLRGPMISKIMEQMLLQTDWPDLDILVIDLPPGTGDIQLSLSQKVQLEGVIMVTTPQALALLDARKAIEMFRKVQVKVLGIVENMSTYVCSHCAHQAFIFGEGGAAELAADYKLPLLGQLPLAPAIRQAGDAGTPMALFQTEQRIADQYQQLAQQVLAHLDKQRATVFPSVVAE